MLKPAPDPSRAFLGVGLAYPARLAQNGTLDLAAYEEDIRQAIRIILGTNQGERVMRPDFGAGLNAFVFEPVSTTTMTLVQHRVRQALIDWEPRIDVMEVKIRADRGPASKLLIDVHYRVRATNVHYNLVYPFYLEEGTAP
jgi:phage baseplate assembly protein W